MCAEAFVDGMDRAWTSIKTHYQLLYKHEVLYWCISTQEVLLRNSEAMILGVVNEASTAKPLSGTVVIDVVHALFLGLFESYMFRVCIQGVGACGWVAMQLGALVAVALPVICVLSALVVYAFAVPVFA